LTWEIVVPFLDSQITAYAAARLFSQPLSLERIHPLVQGCLPDHCGVIAWFPANMSNFEQTPEYLSAIPILLKLVGSDSYDP